MSGFGGFFHLGDFLDSFGGFGGFFHLGNLLDRLGGLGGFFNLGDLLNRLSGFGGFFDRLCTLVCGFGKIGLPYGGRLLSFQYFRKGFTLVGCIGLVLSAVLALGRAEKYERHYDEHDRRRTEAQQGNFIFSTPFQKVYCKHHTAILSPFIILIFREFVEHGARGRRHRRGRAQKPYCIPLKLR